MARNRETKPIRTSTPTDTTSVTKDNVPPNVDLALNEDPNTSLVGSVLLHVLSEHPRSTIDLLDEPAVIAEHLRQHENEPHEHDLEDERFRPRRALAAAIGEQRFHPTHAAPEQPEHDPA